MPVIQIQLEKEATIRAVVRDILAATLPALNLFKFAVHGNPQALAADVTDILPVLHTAIRYAFHTSAYRSPNPTTLILK